MSLPSEVDFAVVKIDGTVVCGLTNATINQSAQSNDRYVRDCTKPGEVPVRLQRITGKSLDVTGTGLTNSTQIATLNAALGVLTDYTVELYQDDGTDAGDLLGTLTMASKATAFNMNLTREGDASMELTLPSHGTWSYAAAP